MIELLNDWSRMWAGFFVPALVQNTLFLGLVFLLLHRFRNASAGVRYAIACVGLVKLLLPPFMSTGWFTSATAESIPLPASTLVFSFSKTSVGAAATGGGSASSLDLIGLLFLVWAVVTVVLLASAVISTIRLATAVRRAVPAEGHEHVAGISADTISVHKSKRISMPMTIGLFPRRIFVPFSWDSWTPQCRRAVLRHELAHVQRRDGLFQTLEILVQALYFFHPMVLILNRRLREYREMACDDASVGQDQDSRLGYSKFLVEMAETALCPPIACESASALIKRKNELLKRVAYQIKESNMQFVSKKQLGVVLALLMVAILPFSFYVGAGDSGDQAVAGTKKHKQASTHEEVTVTLKGDNVYVDGEELHPKKVQMLMTKLSEKYDGNLVVNIKCGKGVSMASVYDLHAALRKADLYKVKYADNKGNSLPLMLPTEASNKKMAKMGKKNMRFVSVGAKGEVYYGDNECSWSKLTKILKKDLKSNPDLVVSVYTKGKTRYNNFVATLAAIKESGVERVMISDPTI